MNWLGFCLMFTFLLVPVTFFLVCVCFLFVSFLNGVAVNFLRSDLTFFNPIDPGAWGTAWSMPAIDPIQEIKLMILATILGFCVWFFLDFLVRKHVLFSFILLAMTMVLYYAIEGFIFSQVAAALIVLMFLLFWQSRSCLTVIGFLFHSFCVIIILLILVVLTVDIDIYQIEVAFVTVSVIAFSLWFPLTYPNRNLDGLIWGGFLVLLAVRRCSTDKDCDVGLYCHKCRQGTLGSRCFPLPITDPFKLVNNSLPFNKYAFLTTHNSYAINGRLVLTGLPRVTLTNQEDSITQQLNNGVRALMLDTYDFEGDIWLCHSHGGECYDFTAFGPAIDTMKEIEAFLSQNPSEIITLILEDYVQAPNGLTKLFNDSGLSKYWFPLSNMPLNGQDWPVVSDMVANNQRLIVFTSIKSKQETEGIAYQWNYMVENQHGDDGMHPGICSNRYESSPLRDKSKSLVLVNYFRTIPFDKDSCRHHWGGLINMLHTCYGAAGDRWANFVAVDYYKRSDKVPFQAVNTLNGKLLCGCDDVHACVRGSTAGTCTP